MPRGLKPSQLKEVSSPKLVYESRAGKPADVAAIATADATDAATTQAMANELKAKMNELLATLKS